MLPFTLPSGPDSTKEASAISGLTEAVKALAKDVSEKMDMFRKQQEALEVRSPMEMLSSEVLSPNNISTPVQEA